MKKFENANIYVEGAGVVRSSLSFDGIVREIGASVSGEKVELPENAVVVPGFIDVHMHGAGGADAMDGTEAALSVIADTVAKEGTTRFLATTMTQSEEKITRAVRAANAYRAARRESGAAVLGVHLEGPFLSPKHCGAQPAEFIRLPDIALYDRLQKAAGGSVRVITVAPETEGADAFIRHVTESGVNVSVGHTDASYREVCFAAECGAKGITHTYNAQRALHHRDAGTVGAALLCDDLYTELIADTVHVSVPAIRLLYKNKPKDKLLLITDAIRAKGIGNGESELGGQKVFVQNGEARLSDGTLAGSVLTMNRAVQNLTEKAGVPFCDAVDCATRNPARYLRVADTYGSIACGKVADFAVLDANFDVLLTVRDGNVIYEK